MPARFAGGPAGAPARWLLAAHLAALLACRGPDPPQIPELPSPPAAGGPAVEAPLAAGEVHRYRLDLAAGDFVRIAVHQEGIDAVLALADPSGATLFEIDRQLRDRGPERLIAVAATGGPHVLEIRGLALGPGRYRLTLGERRPAGLDDRRRAAAFARVAGPEPTPAPEVADAAWTGALATLEELGEEALLGVALDRLGWDRVGRGEWDPAAASFLASAEAFARAGDLRGEALARLQRAACLSAERKDAEAVSEADRALAWARSDGDGYAAARALHTLGQAASRRGDLQSALDLYLESLDHWPAGDRDRTYTLHQLGLLHARFLGDAARGEELLVQALAGWPEGEAASRLGTLSQLGRLAWTRGDLDAARRRMEEAIDLPVADPCVRAVPLARLALVEEAADDRAAADRWLGEARALLAGASCPRQEPTIALHAGAIALGRGDAAAARREYAAARERFAGRNDGSGTIEALVGIAEADRALGDRERALAASAEALARIEQIRPTVVDEGLRSSYFATVQGVYDLRVALHLEAGEIDAAWGTAEQGRARALRDLLQQGRGGGRPVGAAAEPAIAPRALRRELLDADTLLLEIRLGDDAGTLWAVERDAIAAFPLPPRAELERAAREALAVLRSLEWPGRNPPALCALSQALLAPVADRLAGRARLAVVADGTLEALPFAALPDPGDPAAPAIDCAQAPPLIERLEVVALPSATALAVERRRRAGRRPVPGWLAVVADPVYAADGPPALPLAREEAESILARVPPGRALAALGPSASRATVLSGALAGFRVLHFATHGVLDAERPLLSHLELASRDEAGQPVDGVLPAHEIYGLELPAELVVLSACDTALGRQIAGEGLVAGLPRAFLHAGAARVVVSLWAVPDAGSRELMDRFYRGLVGQGLPPARALREAQRELRRDGRKPREWAGFVLLGDWRALPPFLP